VFIGNRVRLVAILQKGTLYSGSSADLPFTLTNVYELVLRPESSVKVPKTLAECEYDRGLRTVGFFKNILPNLKILDVGAFAVTTTDLGLIPLNYLGSALDNLHASIFRCTTEVIYPGCLFKLYQPYPHPINNGMNILRELHLDPFGACFYGQYPPIAAYCQEYSQLERKEWFAAASNRHSGADWVLLQEYPNLERVTLKRAEYHTVNNCRWEVLPQEALIKFVRHAPKLRWFCSDLAQGNIAILKEERPEVELCN
jgi:hypothetical protein